MEISIQPGEDGYWVAERPSLPGCISQGKTRAEALANIREAARGYLAALAEDGLLPAEECFRQGWQGAMEGDVHPLAELWEGVEAQADWPQNEK